MNRLIRELRRRAVFRTAGLYVGVVWIIIEGASVLLPAFDAPDWILRALIIVALIGFPVTIVLAWVFEITDKGIEVQHEMTDTVVIPFGGRRADFVVIGLLTVALVFSVYLNFTSGPEVVEEPDPISVLIADFENKTGDSLFDGTLEQALQIGIESASFITGYRRDAALQLASSMQPVAGLDEAVARLVAVREDIKLVLAGSIEEDDGRYTLYVRAVNPKGGEVLTSVDVDAKDKMNVLAAVGDLAGDLREELGDKSLDRDRLVNSETFTAANLEAAQAYAKAQSLQYNGKYEESIAFYREALSHDENFGRAYSGLALSAGSLGRTDEASAMWEKALANLGSMTERERLRTLGLYYSRVTRNREKAIENYSKLVERFPADDAAHNGLAIQHFYTLDFDAALAAGGKLLDVYPNSIMGRSNYALYAMYASDFDTAVTEARKVRELDPEYFKAWLPIAMQAMADDDLDQATKAYNEMAKLGTRAASTANLGLADIAIYRGDYEQAHSILVEGIASDKASGSQRVAAIKYVTLAEIAFQLGNITMAINAVETGLGLSSGESRSVPAALIYLNAGEVVRAREIASDLGQELQVKSRAYGLLIEGLLAARDGKHVVTIEKLTEAIGLADLWLIRFHRALAFFEAGFYAEALDDLAACMDRKGEATAVFLDDLPSYRYAATLPYWLGRAQRELGMLTQARQSFRQFADRRVNDDPLATDARERMLR